MNECGEENRMKKKHKVSTTVMKQGLFSLCDSLYK